MVIQCPQCSTRFNVKDDLIRDKPVKLKCSKCKHVFVFQRPGAGTPQPSHPRMPAVQPPSAAPAPAPAPAPAAGRASHPRMPVVRPPGAPAPVDVAPAPEPEAPALDAYESFERESVAAPTGPEAPALDAYESFERESVAAGPAESVVAAAPQAASPDGEDASPAEEPAAEEPAAEEPTLPDGAAAVAEPEPAPEPRPTPRPASGSASEPPHHSMPTLTLEDVLPADEPPSRAGRVVGISGVVLLGLAVVAALLVLWRNGWDVAGCTSDPILAVQVAVGRAQRVIVDEDARGIETSVVDSYRTLTGDEREIFVVEGEVLNTTVFPKKLVKVEVSIVTASGKVVGRREVLAGVTLRSRNEIKSMSFLELDDEVRSEEKDALGWVINSNRKASFQAYFTTYPLGVEDITLYSIQALVKDARNAEAQ